MKLSHKLNVRADRPDSRDRIYQRVGTELRDVIDLRLYDSPVEDQSSLGSCTGQAIVGAYECAMVVKDGSYVDLSRLFVYYNERVYINEVMNDSGAYIRDGIKSLIEHGVCKEVLWPHDISKFAVRPPTDAYTEAKSRTITNYRRMFTVEDILDCVNNGMAVVFGCPVYESFYDVTEANPVVKMPAPGEFDIGGHAMTIVGYDIPKRLFLVRNSWGESWGDAGYCWFPFDYISQLADDMWTFDIVTSPEDVPVVIERTWWEDFMKAVTDFFKWMFSWLK